MWRNTYYAYCSCANGAINLPPVGCRCPKGYNLVHSGVHDTCKCPARVPGRPGQVTLALPTVIPEDAVDITVEPTPLAGSYDNIIPRIKLSLTKRPFCKSLCGAVKERLVYI